MSSKENPITSFEIAKPVSLEEVRKDSKKYPRISQCKESYNLLMMMRIIYMAHMYAGKAVDEENLKFMARALLVELEANEFGSRSLTWYEIQRAVRRAILGQAKEKIFIISVASLYNCIIDYIKNEGRFVEEKVRKEKQLEIDRTPSKILETYYKLKNEKK